MRQRRSLKVGFEQVRGYLRDEMALHQTMPRSACHRYLPAVMSPLLRSHGDGSTHHGSGSALRADPCPATAACARQLLNPHPELLPHDLLELYPDRPAHACSRTQRPSAARSPTSTRSHAPTRHTEHCVPTRSRIETPQRLPQNVHTSTPPPIPPDSNPIAAHRIRHASGSLQTVLS
jgi:hypothetical protein